MCKSVVEGGKHAHCHIHITNISYRCKAHILLEIADLLTSMDMTLNQKRQMSVEGSRVLFLFFIQEFYSQI